MGFSRDTLDQVRTLARIEHVIARYIPDMQKRGENLLALCPFHKEKTPSFTISPNKQIFKCFGCHEGGNVFTFIQKIENVSFPESVEIVADIIGYELPKKSDPESEKRAQFFRILDFVARTYHSQLDNSPARPYLESRGVKDSAIKDFNLGYAPDSWDFIKNKLISKSISLNDGKQCGILGFKEESGRYYDQFRGRLMFPIQTIGGNCIGFGGRILDEGQPKYLNSSENKVFSKRNVLYGLDKAAEEIRSLNRVIVVEGYLDVIGCHQEGIKNVVAPLGTALTEDQLTLLSRYCSEVVLLFDSDTAGKKAALRTITTERDLNVVIKIGAIPTGDPFDYILEHGARSLLVIVDSAYEPVEYRLRDLYQKNSFKEPHHLLRELFVLLGEYEFEIEKNNGLKVIAELTNSRFDIIDLDYQKFRGKRKQTISITSTITKKQEKVSFEQRSIEQLIILILHYPELIEKAILDFQEFQIDNPFLKKIITRIFDISENEDELTTDRFFDYFTDEKERKFIISKISADYTIESPESAYTEIYLNMKIHAIDLKLNQFNGMLRKSLDSGNSSRILAEIDIWSREKDKLVRYVYSKNSAQHL